MGDAFSVCNMPTVLLVSHTHDPACWPSFLHSAFTPPFCGLYSFRSLFLNLNYRLPAKNSDQLGNPLQHEHLAILYIFVYVAFKKQSIGTHEENEHFIPAYRL